MNIAVIILWMAGSPRVIIFRNRSKSDLMTTVESSREMVAKTYVTMRQNFAVIRHRLQRPLTLADKVPWY
jgi:hypothetical protein